MLWTILLWITGIATTVVSVGCVVFIFKKKLIRNKSLLVVKYILLALVPLIGGIGSVIAEGEDATQKVLFFMMFILLVTVFSAYLSDIRKDV